MPEDQKEYSNGEIVITWKPDVCIHSANCIRQLPGVFNPAERPWIKIKNADTPHLIEAVDKCPSGAISWKRYNTETFEDQIQAAISASTKVNILKGGPILLKGKFELTDSAGTVISGKDNVALCRCGASGNKPFCDGSHSRIGFKD